MAENTDILVTEGGRERLDQAVQLLAPQFKDDPMFAWMLHSLKESKRSTYLPKLFYSLVKASVLNDAIVFEAGDWGSCGVLMRPGKEPDNPMTILQAGLIPVVLSLGLSGTKRLLFEYGGTATQAKNQVLTKEDFKTGYWYIFLVATATDRRGQGLAGSLLGRMQDEARKDGKAIWLEATTPKSRDLYARHGFKLVQSLVLGRGKVGEDGIAKKGGEGVTIWGMIWRP